jgi:hypothetical protein
VLFKRLIYLPAFTFTPRRDYDISCPGLYILHNMIVEVRRDGYAGVSGDSFSFEPSGATSIRTISKARTVKERVSQWQTVSQVESPVLHKDLQLAVVRYISKGPKFFQNLFDALEGNFTDCNCSSRSLVKNLISSGPFPLICNGG